MTIITDIKIILTFHDVVFFCYGLWVRAWVTTCIHTLSVILQIFIIFNIFLLSRVQVRIVVFFFWDFTSFYGLYEPPIPIKLCTILQFHSIYSISQLFYYNSRDTVWFWFDLYMNSWVQRSFWVPIWFWFDLHINSWVQRNFWKLLNTFIVVFRLLQMSIFLFHLTHCFQFFSGTLSSKVIFFAIKTFFPKAGPLFIWWFDVLQDFSANCLYIWWLYYWYWITLLSRYF